MVLPAHPNTAEIHVCAPAPPSFVLYIYIYDIEKISLKNIKLAWFEVEMFSQTLEQVGLMPECFDVCLDEDSSKV